MSQTVDRVAVATACIRAGLDEDALMEDYSGRAMYGEKCFGVVGDGEALAAFTAALALEIGDEAVELSRSSRTDSMGLDTILYFPGYTLGDA